MEGWRVRRRFWLRPHFWLMLLSALLMSNVSSLPPRTLAQSKPGAHKAVGLTAIKQVARVTHTPAAAPATPAPPPQPLCAQVACLALTFDDGPNPIATPIVLSALENAHASATFFVVGSRAATMPWLLQRMHADGDEIGNHSWSHPDMTTLTPDQVASQFNKTQAAVTAAGVPAPTLFRPPYGFVNDTMRQQIHVPFILWNEDPKDWANRDPAQIIASVEAAARPGGIVDLHGIYTSTGAALPQLLSELQAHYKLVTVSQLLDLHSGQTGEFFGH